MKLLEKQVVAQQKTLERKREIDEGLKLAKQVDALRELVSKEQTNLKKFRDESLMKIRSEIDQAIDELRRYKDEIETLRTEKKALQVLLDGEWGKVNKEKQRLKELSEQLKL